MATLRSVFVSCVMVVALGTTSELLENCEKTWTLQECMVSRIRCRAYFNETDCIDEGGTYYAQGGFCHYCNTCGIFVGYRERCNVTVEGSSVAETLCKPEFVCSARYNGLCLRPDECVYPQQIDL